MKVALVIVAAGLLAFGLSDAFPGRTVHIKPPTTRTVAEDKPAADQETAIWCSVYPDYFTSPRKHHLTARCRFVRYDPGASEDLYAVWLTDRGPRVTRTYFACVWFDGNQETNYVRVAHVGDRAGQDC